MQRIALHGRLGRGKFALVDDEDFAFLTRYTWYSHTAKEDPRIYAITYLWIGGKKRMISMHRFLKNPSPNKLVDHWDGDRINNQKANLRVCTKAQNAMNRHCTWYKGVFYDRRSNGWWSRIGFNRQQVHLGTYNTAEEAAIVYNHAACKYFGEYACYNDIPNWENIHPLTRMDIKKTASPPKKTQKCIYPFKSEIIIQGKALPLGFFETEEKAETARIAALKLYGVED